MEHIGESFSGFQRESDSFNQFSETLDAEIIDKCVINYNQLTLNL
jgi:hypothetical protein